MERLRDLRERRHHVRFPRRLLMLAGLMLGTIGSCGLPTIKPGL